MSDFRLVTIQDYDLSRRVRLEHDKLEVFSDQAEDHTQVVLPPRITETCQVPLVLPIKGQDSYICEN